MWWERKKERYARSRFSELLIEEIKRQDRRIARLSASGRKMNTDNEALRVLVGQLVEPPSVDGCAKVRLRDRAEADEFARYVEERTGQDVYDLEPYGCPICPRQPLTGRKFLHVRHRDPAKRGNWRPQLPKDLGSRVGDRITPAVMERLGYIKHKKGGE